MIRKYLAEPDVIAPNPHYRNGPPMRLFSEERVFRAEGMPEFLIRRAANLNRRRQRTADQAKTSVMDTAAERAKAGPYTLPSSLAHLSLAGMAASIAWHLSQISGGKPFQLPRQKLADLIGTSKETASVCVKLLVRYGYIECVKLGRGREYKFIGPANPVALDDAACRIADLLRRPRLNAA